MSSTEAYVVDGGEERRLRNPNEGPDGEMVPTGVQRRAGLTGVLHLLDQIARRDESRDFRVAARAQANVVRGLLGLETKDYGGEVQASPSQLKIGNVTDVLVIENKP